MYIALDDLSKAADALSGFPSSPKDSRHITLGTFELNVAGGGIDMAFVSDSVGHAGVIVRLTTEQEKRVGQSQSVNLYIPIEAGSIDSFVAKARSIGVTIGAKASLHIADRTADLSR
jgi:hypothetical protein